MAYTVNQRVPEIGLRVALGASPKDVMGLVVREGGVLIMIGLVVGLHDAANETLGLGVLEEVSQNSRHISIRTPLVGAAGIRILQLGSIYLDQREGE